MITVACVAKERLLPLSGAFDKLLQVTAEMPTNVYYLQLCCYTGLPKSLYAREVVFFSLPLYLYMSLLPGLAQAKVTQYT